MKRPKIRRVSLFVAAFLVAATSTVLAAPGDIIFEREGPQGASLPPAIFPHWVHRIRFRCYVCHTQIFELKKGAHKITMDAIKQGKFCGVCHNGKVGFRVEFTSCARCHRRPVSEQGAEEPAPEKEQEPAPEKEQETLPKAEQLDPVKKPPVTEEKLEPIEKKPAKSTPAK